MSEAGFETEVLAALMELRHLPRVVHERTSATVTRRREGAAEMRRWRLQMCHLSQRLAEKFLLVNSTPQTLSQEVADRIGVRLLQVTREKAMWERGQDGWRRFRDEFRGASGFCQFSRIAFDEDHVQALIEVSVQFGSRQGKSELVLLGRRGTIWSLDESLLIWVA